VQRSKPASICTEQCLTARKVAVIVRLVAVIALAMMH
jgi:hypothetical protein